ncbi:MAG: hypothetical protein R2758_05160 [Bacteroidales bacterium]
MSVYAEKFKIPTKPSLASAATNLPSYTPLEEKIINSVYGSAQLSYGDFLFLEGSARNDWSSTLPKTNWSYFYPSVSLSLLLNELVDVNGVDFAKLRVNWAKVGSDTEPYRCRMHLTSHLRRQLSRTDDSNQTLSQEKPESQTRADKLA